MTRAFNDGTGAKYIDSNQALQAVTAPTVVSTSNNLLDRVETLVFETITTTSGDNIITFAAPDKGRIKALRYANGATAADGTNGLELQFINKTNSDANLAYFGVGSGTEAAKATDKAVCSANALLELSNSLTATSAKFNKGDVVSCTIDRDGTAIVGTIELVLEYSVVGRS